MLNSQHPQKGLNWPLGNRNPSIPCRCLLSPRIGNGRVQHCIYPMLGLTVRTTIFSKHCEVMCTMFSGLQGTDLLLVVHILKSVTPDSRGCLLSMAIWDSWKGNNFAKSAEKAEKKLLPFFIFVMFVLLPIIVPQGELCDKRSYCSKDIPTSFQILGYHSTIHTHKPFDDLLIPNINCKEHDTNAFYTLQQAPDNTNTLTEGSEWMFSL